MQNRINPFGEIIETKARGLWMGSRGHIHNLHRKIVRPFKLKAWITCKLEFKNRHREIMAPNLYTELFFLDEATAFAAGHRPCFECRREDYNKFKAAWLKGNAEYKFTDKTSIQAIDEIIHEQRIDKDGLKKTYEENNHNLPDGVFIVVENEPHLIYKKHMHLWTSFGYTQRKQFKPHGKSVVLTPKSVVHAFGAGYMTQVKLGEG